MKTVFILFYILTNPTGGDQYASIPMHDLTRCEHQRLWMQQKGIITANECLKVSYNPG